MHSESADLFLVCCSATRRMQTELQISWQYTEYSASQKTHGMAESLGKLSNICFWGQIWFVLLMIMLQHIYIVHWRQFMITYDILHIGVAF